MPASSSPIGTPEQPWNTVAIVGVGLIGGSIGIDLLQRRLARTVVGIGRREESLQKAREVGACTTTTVELARGVADAQLVIVCTPVGRIAADVREVAEHAPAEAVITDAGSTKAAIVAELARKLPPAARFVGSHPLAGSHRSGPAAAIPGLFTGRTVVVTPSATTRDADAQIVVGFWKSLGATVLQMTPEEHDRLVAAASHLPHVAAAALVGATPAAALPLTAGGWFDATRIAAGDAALWRDILMTNRANVLSSLDNYEKVLAAFRQALERDDAAALVDQLQKAKQARDAVGS